MSWFKEVDLQLSVLESKFNVLKDQLWTNLKHLRHRADSNRETLDIWLQTRLHSFGLNNSNSRRRRRSCSKNNFGNTRKCLYAQQNFLISKKVAWLSLIKNRHTQVFKLNKDACQIKSCISPPSICSQFSESVFPGIFSLLRNSFGTKPMW